MSNSPQNTFFFSGTSRRYLFLELLSRAKPGFAVSASSRRARRRERRFLWGVPFPVSREGNLNRRDSRSIVVVVVVVHIRGSLVMSRARVIARETDAAFLVSGMLFPFSMSRALPEARGVCASFPILSLIFPILSPPQKNTNRKIFDKKQKQKCPKHRRTRSR